MILHLSPIARIQRPLASATTAPSHPPPGSTVLMIFAGAVLRRRWAKLSFLTIFKAEMGLLTDILEPLARELCAATVTPLAFLAARSLLPSLAVLQVFLPLGIIIPKHWFRAVEGK